MQRRGAVITQSNINKPLILHLKAGLATAEVPRKGLASLSLGLEQTSQAGVLVHRVALLFSAVELVGLVGGEHGA